MARFALLSSLLRSLLVAGCALSMAQAQITNVSDDVSTPTPGVGHDYIQLLNETVNPANGSVNVGLTLPVPSGRGITLPFAYSYNSDGVHHLYPSPPWQPSWNGKVLGSVGGWSAAHAPQLSFDGGVQTTVQPDGQNSNCYYVDDFVFSDSAGVLIPFKAYAMDWMSNTNKPCGGA